MLLSQVPTKIPQAFATNGAKRTIPEASQIGITAGAASLNDGFPPLTATPIVAGGIPPNVQDVNGILNLVSANLRWANGGGGAIYDAAFATDANVSGYPLGATLMRADGTGYWINLTDGNTTNPDTGGAGWAPGLNYGSSPVTMTNANVTLTALQYSKRLIVISGTLTTNVILFFPPLVGQWAVHNTTTGAFSVTCKTAAGGGAGTVLSQGTVTIVNGNGVDILTGTSTGLRAATSTTVLATSTLPPSVSGGHVAISSASATTQTLPPVSSFESGSRTSFTNTGAGTATLTRAGSDVIQVNATQINSITLLTGDTLTLESNGGTVWAAVDGSAVLQYSGTFVSNNGANGYMRQPGGVIEQWGSGTTNGSGTLTVTFPIPFPASLVHSITATVVTTSTTVPVAGVGNISASAFDVFVSSANARTFFWKAYGK